jgi:gliding motility-associated-like protein
MRKVLLSLLVLIVTLPGYGQLVINNGPTPSQLIQNTLLGAGVTASNITYTGSPLSVGSFTCNAPSCNMGLSSGIIMSTGNVTGPTSPATYHASTDMGFPGDPMLAAIVAPRPTFDATILEFDFTVTADSVQFRYVFASEEYNDYANTNFNDVFAFFISGPGIAGTQNIALIPGTATPVSINTVNNGNSGGVATGPCMNCQYYVDNVGSSGVFMDGFTTVLTAVAAVQPCQTYHIKLAISDAGDGIFDSQVFLEANSFSSLGQITLFANGVPQPDAATVNACIGTTVNLCLNPASNYTWSTGATTQCITVTQANNVPSGYAGFVAGPGCFAFTTTVFVNFVTPTATITPSGSTSLCPGNTVTLTANTGNTYLWNTGATTQSITTGTAGTYTVTVSAGPNCSAVSAPVVVTVGNPTATITGVTSLCNGTSTTLTANVGQSWLWSTGATTQGISVSSAGTYSVTVTQAGGCSADTMVSVTVNPNPVPAITGTLSFCQGANTILDAGAGFASYSWNTGATTQTLSVTASGTYTVTVTSAAGCTGSTSATTVVNPLPVPVITGTLSFCTGTSTILNAGPGYSSYLWNTGATTQTLSVTAGGNYTVTVTNANGCTGSVNAAVVVNPLPVPNITGTFAFCQGSQTILNAGAGYSSYLWNTGATTQNLTVTNANTYTVTVTNANGCSNSDSQLVTVNPNPVPAITGNNVICQGVSTSFNAGPGYSAYSWSTGASTQSISVNTSGLYTVTVTNANGCSGSASLNLTVNPLPVPAITGTLAFCAGNSSNLNAGGGFSSYLWNTGATTQILPVTTAGNYVVTVTNVFGCSASTNAVVTVNALPVPNITGIFSFCQGSQTTLNAGAGYTNYQWSNGAVSQTINVTAGTYTVTVTNTAGCTGSDSQVVTVNPNPVPAITGTNSICQGTSTVFSAGPGYSAYLWSNGSNASSITVNTAGVYTVTVTDANGCSGTTSRNLTVNPLPAPAITGTTSFCQGQSSNLNAGGGFSSYLWSTGASTQVISVNASGNYIVTVTNGFGCSASANSVVTVNNLPVPNITGPAAVCIGSSTTFNAGGGYASYLWNTGATTQTISTGSAGNYIVTVTSAAGCTGSNSQSLTVNPLPTPAITGTTTICQGTTTQLDAGTGYSSYVWSTGATSQTINTGNAGAVTVTVTDANGCSAPASTSVTVNPLPTPVISGINAFCQGQSSTLDAGTGFTSYLWSTGATSRTINVTTGGNYVVTVTAANGCSGSDNQQITVHPNPTPVIAGGTGICFGTSTTLNAGGGYSSYLWNNGSTTQTISVSNAGNYTVTVTSAFGCSGSNSTSMVINPLPTPAITGVVEICQGVTTTFDAGAGYSAYQWSNGAVTQTISPGTAGIYTVTVTDSNGCQNDDTIALTVNALPVPSITGTLAFCQGDNSNLNAGGGYSQYQWSNGSSTQVINVTTGGNYAVTVTDNNGCSGSTSVNITVNQLPNPVITGQGVICQGDAAVWNAGNGYSGYLWSNGTTAQTISVSTAGTYSVTVTDINGCSNSTSSSLSVNPLPTATVAGSTDICIGASTTLTFNFTGTAPFNYVYTNGGNNFTGTATGNTGSQTVSPTSTMTYTLVSVTDANCAGTISGNATVTVNPLPQPLITGDLSICDGETTLLAATPGFPSYNWSNGANAANQLTGTAGIYTVTVIDNNGCEGTSPAVNLVVNAVPVISFTNDTSLTCAVPNINFTNLSTYDSGSDISWNFGDGGTSNEASPSHIFTQPGTYNISLTITTPAGCTSTASSSVEITFYPLPDADFVTSPDVTTVFNGKITFVDRSSYAVKWHWQFGDGADSDLQNPVHYYNEVGDFRVKLTVENIAGCVDEYEEVIPINPFYIPNAFTPNGDGINDNFFDAGYILDVSSYNMKIFNRWGQLVFTGTDVNQHWEGLDHDGNPAPQGTYVYSIQVTTRGGKDYVFNGQVNLIR